MTDFKNVQHIIYNSLSALESPDFIRKNAPFKGPEKLISQIFKNKKMVVIHTNILTMKETSRHHISDKSCKICKFFN